jgi:diguanylate cyclase (GGDEF)-like protein/PAS domain S-box-containing protein
MDENTANLQVGHGIAKGEQALAVGAKAARQAVRGLKKKGLSAILVFASVRYDLAEVLQGIHGVVGQAPVMGATTAGEICDGPQQGSVVVVALASPYLKVRVGVGQGVSQDWRQAVTQAVNTPEVKPFFDPQDTGIWPEMTRQGKSAFGLLFSPGNTRAADSRSFEILEELKRLSLNRLPIIGGAAADDWRLETNYVLWGRQAYPDSVLVAVFETQLQFGIAMAHGFQPTSRKATVTRVKNHEVLELDGKPAADVYSQLLCISRVALEGKHLTLTTKRPAGILDAYGQYSLNVASFFTPEHGVRFSQPMVEGTLLTIMDADQSSLLAAGGEAVRKAILRGGITDPAMVLAFPCALRSLVLEGWGGEEIAAIRKMLPTTPVVGFYSFGEQGVADDGVNRHNNEVIAALALDRELSHGARVALEQAHLQQELEQRRAELMTSNEQLRREIAERRRAEEALKESHGFLKNIFASIQDGISILDLDYNIIGCNTAIERWFPHAMPLEGKKCYTVYHNRREPCEVCPYTHTLKTGKMAVNMSPRHGEDGKIVGWVELHSFPMQDNATGKMTGVIEYVRDITDRKLAEETLQGSEARYHSLVENIDLGIALIDSDYRINMLNAAQGKFFQKPASELIGQECFRVFEKRQAVCQGCPGTMAMATGRAAEADREGVRDDGSRFAARIHAFPLFGPDGAPTGFIHVVEDITTRKQAEDALRGSEQRFRDVSENVAEWIWEVDQQGKYTYSSPVVEKLLGYKPGEVLGKYFYEFFHPEDRESLMQEALAIISTKRPFREFLNRNLHKNGKIVWLSTSGVPVLDDGGKFLGYRGSDTDITAQRQAEAQLRQNEEWFRQIYDSAPVMMHSIDADGLICNVNRKWLESMGYTRDEVMGAKVFRFMRKESARRCQESTLPQFWRDGFVRDIPYQFVKKNGDVMEALLDCAVTQDPSGQSVSLSVVRDITGIKKAENSFRQANEQLQRLVFESERRNLEITQLNLLSELLQSCRQVKETYPLIAQSVQELFPARSGALFILDPVRNLLEAEALWGAPLAGEPVFAPDDCWALRRGKLHIAVAGNQGPHCRHLPAAFAHDYLCLPLLAGGELFGLVHVQGLGDLTPERSESLPRLAVTVADHITLSLSNLKLRDTLRHQAIHDPLTGLFNRRYLEETLEREWRRVQRKAAPLGVIMLDLDHFKRFNDTYGHAAGDDLLRTLGLLLQTQVRQEDVACRYGGEEFVLILPEAPLEVVLERAEEIRQMAPRLQVFQEGKLLESTTVSLGVAMFPEHGATGDEVIQAADNAMYQAKAAGRNRIVVAATRDTASSNPDM